MDSKSESNDTLLTIKLPEIPKNPKLTKSSSNEDLVDSIDDNLNDQETNDSKESIDRNIRDDSLNKTNITSNSSSIKETLINNKSKNEKSIGNKDNEEVVKIDPNQLKQKTEEEEREKMQ
jgi:hypothetical protein